MEEINFYVRFLLAEYLRTFLVYVRWNKYLSPESREHWKLTSIQKISFEFFELSPENYIYLFTIMTIVKYKTGIIPRVTLNYNVPIATEYDYKSKAIIQYHDIEWS